MKKQLLFSMAIFSGALFFQINSHGAATSDRDERKPLLTKEEREEIEQNLFRFLERSKTNEPIVGFALEQGGSSKDSQKLSKEVLHRALDQEFNDRLSIFPNPLQVLLKKLWTDKSWIDFTPKREYWLPSEPLGKLNLENIEVPTLILDGRLESLPLQSRIYQMILLIHQIGPKIQMIEKYGVKLDQKILQTIDTLTGSSAQWALLHWRRHPRLASLLDIEIRLADLPLYEIQELLEMQSVLRRINPLILFNDFLATHHTYVLANPGPVKDHLKKWIDQCVIAEPGDFFSKKKSSPQNSAPRGQILSFPKNAPQISCSKALNPNDPKNEL